MSFANYPELRSFFSTYFPEADPAADAITVGAFLAAADAGRKAKVLAQARALASGDGLSIEDLGIETNRWFGDVEEAKEWIHSLVALLDASAGDDETEGAVETKDSNGTVLAEGDNVTVIKDLKVKGGSSDLKRGTLVRKIHLIGDPENIECRVDGSTLVLKTCFLRKA